MHAAGYAPVVGRVAGSGPDAVRPLLQKAKAVRGAQPLFVSVHMQLPPVPDAPVLRQLFTEPGQDEAGGAHRAALNRMDQTLGALASGLERLGYRKGNTVFAVVGRSHDPGTEVPFVVWGGVVPVAQVQDSATLADAAPTLLGLAGVQGYQGSGRDWSQWRPGR
jgi:hypothetical protein